MVFHKIRSLSMTELFVREIKRMILMGELKIGDRLPPERELAQKMGLKLTVVNSGIAQLQQMGFLKAAPRQAVYVEDYLTNGNIRTMMEMIDFTDHVIDEDLLELMIHIRATLEQFIFRKACESCSEEHVKELEALVEQSRAAEDENDIPELCYRFYHQTAKYCGNPFFPMFTQTFRDGYLYFIRYSLDNGIFSREWLCAHEKSLIEFIRKRDAEAMDREVLKGIQTWNDSFRKSDKFRMQQSE